MWQVSRWESCDKVQMRWNNSSVHPSASSITQNASPADQSKTQFIRVVVNLQLLPVFLQHSMSLLSYQKISEHSSIIVKSNLLCVQLTIHNCVQKCVHCPNSLPLPAPGHDGHHISSLHIMLAGIFAMLIDVFDEYMKYLDISLLHPDTRLWHLYKRPWVSQLLATFTGSITL